MAIDHKILQSIGIRDNANVLNMFNNALLARQNRKVSDESFKQQQIQTSELERQQALVNSPGSQLLQQQTQAESIAKGYANSLRGLLESNNIPGLEQQLQRNKARLTELGMSTAGVDEDLIQIQTPEGLAMLAQEVKSTLSGNVQQSVGQRDFNANVAAVKADPELKTTEGRAASIALGLTAKASLTKDERVANNKALGEKVAAQKGAEASAVEGAKLTQQKLFKPQISRLVKEAERQASQQGEALSDLARMEATLPTLKETISQLKDLAFMATSTIGGRAFDFALKESGFGSTKGANARAKLIAIVSNQVLPLLKETFGSAFTEGEGKRLEASLVDPDASPTQKVEQLTSFIEQKERNILAAQQRLQNLQQQEVGFNADVPQATPEVVPPADLSNLSIEELIAERNRLGGQ